MDVLVTGAFGRVGTAIIDHLADDEEYDFTYLDREPNEEYDSIVADITDEDAVRDAVAGRDAVVHLAASLMADDWPTTLENNVIGYYNVLDAAAESGVEKFVFASSIHATGMYEHENVPDIYYPEFNLTIDYTSPIRPDSYYGTSKAFGEDLGRYYVENFDHPTQFYGLRICSIRHEPYDHPYGDAEQGVEEGEWEWGSDEYEEQVARLKCTWQSRRDFAQMVDCCLRDETIEYGNYYGVSDNDRRWVDIENAREEIGYDPQDNGEEWDGPPSR
jgi:hypothetical protein